MHSVQNRLLTMIAPEKCETRRSARDEEHDEEDILEEGDEELDEGGQEYVGGCHGQNAGRFSDCQGQE